jgi:hypothetical protein
MIQLPTHEDMQLLIKAIENLKAEDNLVKDYIYPIALAFVSAVMGSLFGYYVILTREKVEAEKAKIDATNKLLLEAIDCFHDLEAIKGNYLGKLTDNPTQRLACVPPILMLHRPSNPEFAGMFYLAKDASKIFKSRTFKEAQDNFANIPRIKLIFENYNTALEMWKTRNELVLPIFEAIVSKNSATGVANVSLEDMVRSATHLKVAQLMDLNEKVLSLTDDLLAEFMKLMMELPKISEQLISKKVMEKYGKVFKLEFSQETQAMVSSRVLVNQEALSKILGA